jgi:MFS family permease
VTKLRRFSAETFRSLRTRNFRLFFVGQLISQTGSWLSTITQTLLVLHLTDSGIVLGMLTAAQFGPVLVLGAWAGAVADRADKRRLLMIVQSLGMVQSVVLGVLVLAGWATVPVVFAMAAVQGVLTAFDNPARRSFVVEMVSDDDLPNAVSLNSTVMTGARVVGPAAAGALVVVLGYGWPFILDGLSYLAVLANLARMDPAALNRAAPMPKAKGQVREGLQHIRSRPDLLVPLVMMGVVGTLAFNFSVTIPLLVKGPLGGDTTTFTLLFSVLSLGSMVGALATARRATVTPRHLVVGATTFGVSMLALAVAPNLATAFVVAVAIGLGSIGFLTSSTAIVQLLAMVFLGSTPIGGPLVGWFADAAGPRAAIALGGVACLVAAGYGARALGVDLRVRTRHAAEAVADDGIALVD